MPDTDFTIKLDGSGLKLDQKVSKELANRIVMLVLSDGKTGDQNDAEPDRLERTPSRKSGSGRTLSLREYINQHEAKKITQQMTAIGAYYQEKNNLQYFTRAELNGGFEEAKLQPPANPSRDIARTIGEGWIAPKSDADDQYYVTGTGESALEKNFKVPKGGARPRKKRAKKAAKKTTR